MGTFILILFAIILVIGIIRVASRPYEGFWDLVMDMLLLDLLIDLLEDVMNNLNDD